MKKICSKFKWKFWKYPGKGFGVNPDTGWYLHGADEHVHQAGYTSVFIAPNQNNTWTACYSYWGLFSHTLSLSFLIFSLCIDWFLLLSCLLVHNLPDKLLNVKQASDLPAVQKSRHRIDPDAIPSPVSFLCAACLSLLHPVLSATTPLSLTLKHCHIVGRLIGAVE